MRAFGPGSSEPGVASDAGWLVGAKEVGLTQKTFGLRAPKYY